MRWRAVWPLAAAMLMTSCEEEPGVLAIQATGSIAGSAFVDVNGNGLRDDADRPFPGLRVVVSFRGVRDTVASTLTAADGRFRLDGLPVGDYIVTVDSAAVPDSLRLARISGTAARVTATDTAVVAVVVTYPQASVVQARGLPAGRRILVDGVVLNRADAFIEPLVHVRGGGAAIRVAGASGAGLEVGDSVRLLVSTARRDGQPILEATSAFRLGSVMDTVRPHQLSSATAASADGGTRDADLVGIVGATIASTIPSGATFRFNVDDGSGSLEAEVRLDRGFDLQVLQPGIELNVVGVLVPAGAGRWRLRPRGPADVSLGFPTATVAEARALPVGSSVIVIATALNDRAAFGDQTVHIGDATAAIRGTNVRPGTLLAGDLARFTGVIRRRDGQPVLDDVAPFVLSVGTLPAPIRTTTAVAATANGGAFDAAQIQVRQAVVTSITTVGDTLIATVDDGSGPLDVAVRTDANLALDPFAPGAVLDVTGLLVPRSVSPPRWRLRVRTAADVVRVGGS